MKYIDISVPITSELPNWPGDPQVSFHVLSAISLGDESNLTQISMSLHTGTHIDAPKHFFDSGLTTDQIPLEKLIGDVLVVGMDNSVDVITEYLLQTHPQWAEIKQAKKILFKTRNSNFWHTQSHKFRTDFVGIDTSAANLLTQFNLDLIGIDYFSVAPFDETSSPHQVLLSREIVVLEGIDLSNVNPGFYQLICLPIKVFECEGAPARAILMDSSPS